MRFGHSLGFMPGDLLFGVDAEGHLGLVYQDPATITGPKTGALAGAGWHHVDPEFVAIGEEQRYE